MSESRYWPAIDGVRGIAVLAVIANHLGDHFLESGFLGVDIFFVISGFVISASLSARKRSTLSSFLIDFYARRVRRLLPALIVCVLLTSICLALVNPAANQSIKTGMFALVGASNLYLWLQSSNYFAESAELNAFLQTWSLGVEEQFYLIFPLLFWCFTRRLGQVLIGLSLLSFSMFWFAMKASPSSAFYLMPMRFWELGLGAIVYWFASRRESRSTSIALTRIPTSVILVLLLLVLHAPIEWQTLSTPIVVLLTALMLWQIFEREPLPVSNIVSSSALRYVGRISYSLYLWHWAVFVLSRWTIGVEPWTWPIQLALSWLLADLSYRFIENPLRNVSWPQASISTVGFGVAGSAASVALLWVLAVPLSGRLFTGNTPPIEAYGVHTLTNPYRVEGGAGVWQGRECVMADNADVGGLYSAANCTLGAGGGPRLLVLGDSVSASFIAGFDRLVRDREWSVTLVSAWGASPVPEVPNRTAWSAANEDYWVRVVPSLVSELRQGDAILLINELAGYSPRTATELSQSRLAALERGLRRWGKELQAYGISLHILHGYPMVRELQCDPALAVPQWFAPFGSPCRFQTKAALLSRRSSLDLLLRQLEQEGLIEVVDLFDVFCPTDLCTYRGPGGEILYRDVFSHPSIEGSRASGALIAEAIG
jgi:peptidoglycan/LPS O-acetylase OafA/YrhL